MIERLLPGLAALSLEELYEELTERGIVFALASEKGAVRSMLTRTGLLHRVGAERCFPTVAAAVAALGASVHSGVSDN